MRLTRRTFIKAAGVTGAATAVLTRVGPSLLGKVTPAAAQEGEKYVANVCLQCPAGGSVAFKCYQGNCPAFLTNSVQFL